MARKIEMNMTFDMVHELAKQRHVPPIVTVAIRADGTVEKITFVVSSGVLKLSMKQCEGSSPARHPTVRSPKPSARQYDVVEIRRTWIFDTAIRLQ
ncbi:hypothetical protein LP420_22310 [Massilia sp. B-10]|nr:hypothetical protein LP420_22310 [Massilia sp. B-10]